MTGDHPARRLWRSIEPIHAVTYVAPGCREAAADLGLRGFWMGYFAFRAAPLGPVGPAPDEALFAGFHPDRVARALPDAWSVATADRCLRWPRRPRPPSRCSATPTRWAYREVGEFRRTTVW